MAAVGLHGVRRTRLQRALRDMTRALGGVRECDVAIAMAKDLAAAPGAEAALRRALRRWVVAMQARRRTARQDVADACAPGRTAWVDVHLEALVAARAAEDDQRWRRRLSAQLDARARRLRARVDRAGVLFAVDPLHDVRIATKRLRYLIEIVAECRLAPVARPLSLLKRAQDALGRLHDLDVLQAHLAALVTDAPASADEAGAIARTTRGLERESREAHGAYLRVREALTRLTDVVRDDVVPRVAPPARRLRPSRSSDVH